MDPFQSPMFRIFKRREGAATRRLGTPQIKPFCARPLLQGPTLDGFKMLKIFKVYPARCRTSLTLCKAKATWAHWRMENVARSFLSTFYAKQWIFLQFETCQKRCHQRQDEFLQLCQSPREHAGRFDAEKDGYGMGEPCEGAWWQSTGKSPTLVRPVKE